MTTVSSMLYLFAVLAAIRSVDLHNRDCRIHVWEKLAYALILGAVFTDHLAR